MIFRGFLFFLSILIGGVGSLAASADPVIQAYRVDPKTERIRMYWKGADGVPYQSISAFLKAKDYPNGVIGMVMNGGIYDPLSRPLGLYIENSRRLVPLNLADGDGNFFMKPNGVFFLRKGVAAIADARDFKDHPDITDAVQSGPLMIKNGVIHPRFRVGSDSRKVRNAVGVTAQGDVVFFLSSDPVNFYDFARFAQKRHAIVDLLYLDGTISQMYTKTGAVPALEYPLTTMIAVEKIP